MAGTMMASKAASYVGSEVAKKVSDKIENPGVTECTGPQCCVGSTCMNIPGMSCRDSRGDTTCIGYSYIAGQEGVCACVHGACNGAGLCPDSPEYVADGTATSAASYAPGLPVPAPAPSSSTATAELAVGAQPPGQTAQLPAAAKPADASSGDQSGGDFAVLPIIGAVALVGVVISVAVCVIKRRQNDDYDDDDDEENSRTPLQPLHIARTYPGKVKGPGH